MARTSYFGRRFPPAPQHRRTITLADSETGNVFVHLLEHVPLCYGKNSVPFPARRFLQGCRGQLDFLWRPGSSFFHQSDQTPQESRSGAIPKHVDSSFTWCASFPTSKTSGAGSISIVSGLLKCWIRTPTFTHAQNNASCTSPLTSLVITSVAARVYAYTRKYEHAYTGVLHHSTITPDYTTRRAIPSGQHKYHLHPANTL